MDTIKRKNLIYKTEVEYGDYTLNYILGCSHGCKYPCYAFLQKKRFGIIKGYEEWCKPTIVDNTLDILNKEIPKLKNKISILHLCFTTDPFMYQNDEVKALSLSVLNEANENGIKCSVLSKGVLPTELLDLPKDNEYGITIVSLSEEFRQEMEPGAAPMKARVDSLKYLHDNGCKTWVSIEPYPTPNIIDQDLNIILDSISFVDKIIFGRMNYNKKVTSYKGYKEFYNNCADKVIAFCNENNIDYHIKKGTIAD